MKPVRKILIVVGLICMVLGVRMIMLANGSPSVVNKKLGIFDGHLQACGEKPNCVSTQADKTSKFYVKSITGDNVMSLWDNLNMMLKDLGLEVISSN